MANTKLIFPLIRKALISTPIDETLYQSLTIEDWDALREYASQQGVVAISFDGIDTNVIHIPKKALMRWYGYAELIKNKRREHITAIKAMRRVMKEIGVDMLVFKGLSLAKYYPIPASREFGDLDTFTLFDNIEDKVIVHDKVNKYFESKGIEIEYWDRHDVFDYVGVHVEHHSYFANSCTKANRLTNQKLFEILAKQKGKQISSNIYYPSADFNAILILTHTVGHMSYEGATIKNILDWGMFLLKDGENVNWDDIKAFYAESGWTKGFNVLTMVAEIMLEAGLSKYYIGEPDKILAQKVYDFVLDTKLHQEADYILPIRVWKKWQRMLSRRWMYTSGLIPANFWSEAFMGSLKEHITRPEQF